MYLNSVLFLLDANLLKVILICRAGLDRKLFFKNVFNILHALCYFQNIFYMQMTPDCIYLYTKQEMPVYLGPCCIIDAR